MNTIFVDIRAIMAGTKIRQLTVGMPVFDRWWPVERRGVVKKVYASSVVIKWIDGKEWRYDKDHLRFVERL